jgi:hydrogenase-4 membrane subunit HyfE
MFGQIARVLPFLMAGLLLLNLVTAIADGGRANWLAVAFVALLLALMLFRRTRATRVH